MASTALHATIPEVLDDFVKRQKKAFRGPKAAYLVPPSICEVRAPLDKMESRECARDEDLRRNKS